MRTISVSVVIPTYNRAAMVRRAVRSALAQTVSDIEVIVVDDGSTDTTRKVISRVTDRRLIYVRHPENRGGSAARNSGISRTSGEFIAFLDSDDVWRREKLEKQLTELRGRGQEWIAVYCGARQRRANVILEQIDRWVPRPTGVEGGAELIKPILLRKLAFGGASTLMAKRQPILDIGGFNESFDRYQDVELLVRLLRLGRLAYVDEVLVDKYDTGLPDPYAARQALEYLSLRFHDLIESLDIEDEFRRTQNCFILKHYLAEGRFADGWKTFHNARCPHVRDALGLVLAVFRGLRSRAAGLIQEI